MKSIVISLLLGGIGGAQPDTLSLEYCYSRIENHYPLARKAELQQKITDLNVRIANSGYFPQLELGARADYRSEVTQFPGGASVEQPILSRDQYELSLNVAQPVYNGGAAGIRKKLEAAKGEREKLSAEVQMQELRAGVDRVYYNILLAQQQEKVVRLLMENLQARLNTISAQVEKGTQLPSQKYILRAELIKARQDSAATRSGLRAGYKVLSELIGETVTPDTPLRYSDATDEQLLNSGSRRVELQLFESSRSALEYRKQLETVNKYPAVSLYGTAAYGRPGYNFFEDEMHGYYMAGIRISWSFWDWNSAGKRNRALTYRQQQIEEESRAFRIQLNTGLRQIEERIETLNDQINRDREIVALREKVAEEKESQLREGTITATEYVTELNSALQAEYTLMTHRIQLSRAKTEYKTALGINSSNRGE